MVSSSSMDDYSRHYAILKVTHETDWQALRARYKRLIGQWHPDRFQPDAPERELAEEHSKQITLAYQALERYYRDHGVLPGLEPQGGAGEAPAEGRSSAPPENALRGKRPAVDASRYRAARPPQRRRALIVLSSILMAAFAAYHYYSDEEALSPPANDVEVRAEAAAEAAHRGPDAPPPVPAGISAGSTLGEVYAIQGVPSQTEGEVWHYGKSTVRFAQGKVVAWTVHPDNPLRIARDQPVQLREGQFGLGSTKDDVRSIQGTPVTETETVWDYGPSRVYFERNRVVRWENSPLQPLHVPH
jgi:hypothetical protein